MNQFANIIYTCPQCTTEWCKDWAKITVDTCPVCGFENISPHYICEK